MILSRRKQLLFIHVPRTGGTTISNILHKHCKDIQIIGHQHSSFIDLPTNWSSRVKQYTIFTVIRHPIGRLYSWYCLHQQSPSNLSSSINFYDFLKNNDNNNTSFRFNQLDYILTPEGNLGVNKIIKHENYETEVLAFFSQKSIYLPSLPKLNNCQKNLNISHIKFDPPLLDLIYSLCYKDVDYFK